MTTIDLILGTAGIYVGINVVGIVLSMAIIRWRVPTRLSIQNRDHRWATLRARMPLVLLNMTILMVLTAVGLGLIGQVFDPFMRDLWVIAPQVAIVLLIDDGWFYAWHRMLHENKWLYSRVHRIHHRAYCPMPIEYIYVHPIEWMVGSIGPILGLVLVHLTWGIVSIWAFWGYLLVRNLHELNVHSSVRSGIGTVLPLYGLTEHHDLHHSRPNMGNYASTFTLWDRVFKTIWRPEPQSIGG